MDAVAAAFADVPRTGFLRRESRNLAGLDAPVTIGHGQTNSQPSTVADMLRLLDVRAGQRVLDIGAGSGWTTALLGHLVGPTGLVVGVELLGELAAWGEQNVRATPYDWASVRETEPGVLGLPGRGPFDRILVSADPGRFPTPLLDQLAPESRLVIPVAGRMTLVVRHDGRDEFSEHGRYRFVPLVWGDE